jgi:tRNA(Ile)-lysidine synthetase-like protein
MLNDNNGTKTIDLENGYCFIRSYDKAYIDRCDSLDKNEYILDINDEIIFNDKYKFYFTKNITNLNVNHIRLCYNKLNLPFKIRTKKDGDFIKLNIGNKKLNRLFIDKKIDKLKRDFIPVILDNNDNVLWVYNYAKNIDIVDYKDTGDIYLVCEEI